MRFLRKVKNALEISIAFNLIGLLKMFFNLYLSSETEDELHSSRIHKISSMRPYEYITALIKGTADKHRFSIINAAEQVTVLFVHSMLSARCFSLNRLVAVTLPQVQGINDKKKHRAASKCAECYFLPKLVCVGDARVRK
jgi:hypothetical protein